MADFTVAAKEPGEEVIVDLEMRIPTTAMWSWTQNKDTGLANRTAPRSRKKGLVHGTSPIISEMGSGTRELREEHKTAEPGDLFDPGPSPMPLKDHFS